MSWWKKLLDKNEMLCNVELNRYNFKKTKKEKTLEEWRIETKNKYLKIRDNKSDEPPYITYFFKHCQYCNAFIPHTCFNEQGKIHNDRMLICSQLRLNIKLLQD